MSKLMKCMRGKSCVACGALMRGATGLEFGRMRGCRKGESEADTPERGRGLIGIVSPEFIGIVSPEFRN